MVNRKYIDFGNFKVFPEAGIQTMIYSYQKKKPRNTYIVDYTKVINSKSPVEKVKSILLGQEHPDSVTYPAKIEPSSFMGKTITFLDKRIYELTKKIANQSNFKIKNNEIGNGIDVLQDFISEKHIANLDDKTIKKGDGIFVLPKNYILEMTLNEKERQYLKPYYDSSQINRYLALETKSEYKIIYADKFFRENIHLFPKLKNHLDKFKPVLTSVFAPYGLHRARNEKFFKGTGIFSLRKTVRPAFSYVEFPCYTTRAFLISQPRNIDYKYLTAILNSKLINFWLRHKGKLQGNLLQIDKEPLINLPIVNIPEKNQPFIDATNKMVNLNNRFYQRSDKFMAHLAFQWVYTRCSVSGI